MEVASFSNLPVGVLLWNAPEPRATVIAKVTLSFGPAGVWLADAHAPIHGPQVSRFGSVTELHHPGDFAPRKAECDVLLTGHAHADAPSLVIGANVRIGTVRKRFYALTTERTRFIPLSSAYLREAPIADSVEVTVGPLGPGHVEREPYRATRLQGGAALRREVLNAGFDFAFFNSAPSDQRLSAIEPGMEIRLYGLAPGGAMIHGYLPRRWPRVFVPDGLRGQGLRELSMFCDTLWIDTDQSVCELTFRGVLRLRDHASLPSRIVVTLAEAGESLDPARIESHAAFVRPVRAAMPEDAETPSVDLTLRRGGESLRHALDLPQVGTQILPPEEPAPESDRTLFRPAPQRVEPERFAPPAPPEPVLAQPIAPSPKPANVGRSAFEMLSAPAPSTPVDPERTMLHTGAQRPVTLPFASTPVPATPPLPATPAVPVTPSFAVTPPMPVTPAVSAPLPVSGPPKKHTLELPPEVNPALAALPFSRAEMKRIRTLDVAAGAESRAPLPFSGNSQSEGTLVGPAPRADGASPALPFAAKAPSAKAPFVDPVAPPSFGLPPAKALGSLAPGQTIEAPSPAFLRDPAANVGAPWAPVRPRPILVPEDTESVSDTLPPAPGTLAHDTLPPEAADPPTIPPAAAPLAADPITLVPPKYSAGDTLPPLQGARETLPPLQGAHDTLPPLPGGRDTLPPTAIAPAIPFAPAAPSALGGPLSLGRSTTTVGQSSPTPALQESAAPPPWAAGLALAHSTNRADLVGPRGPAAATLGILPLEKEAALQLALWREEASLPEVLAAHGVDEITWREHRRLRDEALRHEAESGEGDKAQALHEAIEHARKGPEDKAPPTLDLATYAAVRAVMRDADDEAEVLRARGIEPATWERDHRRYRRRLLEDAAFAEQFRRAIEASARPPEPAKSAPNAAPKETANLQKPGKTKAKSPRRKMTRSRPLGEEPPQGPKGVRPR